ncbi:MAG: hypothetical protein DMF00_12975 [Verrucomicrobia bacterium]|nr:MAG: hypothetical protein DMF00_12975 [Verrucomicrobiota bacterium]
MKSDPTETAGKYPRVPAFSRVLESTAGNQLRHRPRALPLWRDSDSAAHLGTVVSSERSKDEVKRMDKASEVILALKPVTFRYKPELDPVGIEQFGLVAEEVEK